MLAIDDPQQMKMFVSFQTLGTIVVGNNRFILAQRSRDGHDRNRQDGYRNPNFVDDCVAGANLHPIQFSSVVWV